MTKTEHQCPTCERYMLPPRRWFDGAVIWINVILASTFMAVLILDPPASFVATCLKGAKAGLESAASCHSPAEPWLALGWVAYAACWVFTILLIRQGFIDARKDRERWARVKSRLVEKSPRSWREQWRW